MYILPFTLRQHTPIIHFQHDQEGATLRATEVKPKLDRFIWAKWKDDEGNIDKAFGKYAKYLLGYDPEKPNEIKKKFDKGFRALDYKLRIESTKKTDSSIIITEPKHGKYNSRAFPLLLANMGGKAKKEDLRDLVFFEVNDCSIFCLYPDLKRVLADNLTYFFSTEGFGNRSTKGFGSFTVQTIDNGQDCLTESIEWLKKRAILQIETNASNYSSMFIAVDYIWKLIKSGVNYSKCEKGQLSSTGYLKSFLYEYLTEKYKQETLRVSWEKRWIKETFMGIPKETKEDKTPKFARALLGLSDKFEYKGKIKDCNKEYSAQSPFHDFTVNINNEEIERIKSPVIFKPIITAEKKYSIYVIVDTDAAILDIFGKPFNFKLADIKDFKLQTGYDEKTKKPINHYIRPNTKFEDIDDNILDAAIAESEADNKVKNQITNLKDYCAMTSYFSSISKTYTLNTPEKGVINIPDLLKQFAKKYTNIAARDFSGEVIINCKLKALDYE
jgi:hypothetical protein